MAKSKKKSSAIHSLLWAGNPFSFPWLGVLDLYVPIIRVKKLKRLL